jgi:hypothetical protein
MIKATIKSTSPRYQEWLEVFGSDTVEIECASPIENEGPDGRRAKFYRIKLPVLSPDQRRRAIRLKARKFELSLFEVAETIDDPRHGLPIFADDVIVSVDVQTTEEEPAA